MTVLLIAEVDDDIAMILTCICQGAGMTVLQARDGVEALGMAVTGRMWC